MRFSHIDKWVKVFERLQLWILVELWSSHGCCMLLFGCVAWLKDLIEKEQTVFVLGSLWCGSPSGGSECRTWSPVCQVCLREQRFCPFFLSRTMSWVFEVPYVWAKLHCSFLLFFCRSELSLVLEVVDQSLIQPQSDVWSSWVGYNFLNLLNLATKTRSASIHGVFRVASKKAMTLWLVSVVLLGFSKSRSS